MENKKNNLKTWFRYGILFGFIIGIVILKIILSNYE